MNEGLLNHVKHPVSFFVEIEKLYNPFEINYSNIIQWQLLYNLLLNTRSINFAFYFFKITISNINNQTKLKKGTFDKDILEDLY